MYILLVSWFKFTTAGELWPYVAVESSLKLQPHDIINQLEPFHYECRAFARLKERGCEYAAVRCYGYILLGQRRETLLKTSSA
jgi:hypothetical protein